MIMQLNNLTGNVLMIHIKRLLIGAVAVGVSLEALAMLAAYPVIAFSLVITALAYVVGLMMLTWLDK
jgi:hypothetical protein